ncbi:MAG: sugar ABC transporter permease [Actinobacteria bacterium]|nr:sugar ABC transporter permease [Actinomycetota bacterium]
MAQSAAAVRAAAGRHRTSAAAWRDFRAGLLFGAPAIIGLLVFSVYPILSSLVDSFTAFDMIRPAKFIGLDNYVTLFTQDPLFWSTLYNTAYYVVFSVPLGIIVAFGLAMLLNQKVGGLSIYRTIFYLPSITPFVATAVLWVWVFNPQYGLLNTLLAFIGIQGPGWLSDPDWSKPALIIMSVWSVGGLMVIFLAGLQGVPQEQYEAAQIDGANRFQLLRHVTIPFMGPYFLFGLITGLIGGFQYFTQVYVMTQGGPANSTNMYSLYLFLNAFSYFKMGYASAMAWILFLLIGLCTVIVFRSSVSRVYYGGS